jgi:hypothetical protein
MTPIAILLLLLLSACLAVLARRAIARRDARALEKAVNLERQKFLISRMDALSVVLANPDLPLAEARRQTDALLAEMASINLDGQLDPLLADNRDYVDEALARRAAS